MAEDANNLPFKQELELAKYLTGIFGNSEKANPNYSGKVIKPEMVPEMSSTDMNAVMTEWLRGNGQFLDKMREQNLSGLFNTSTQKLMANDLTAQAALKAAQLNTNIKQGNTQLANSYYAKVSTQPSKTIKGGGLSNTEKAIAMILSALNQGEAKKGSTTKKGKDGSVSPDREQNNLDKMMGAISEAFGDMFNTKSSDSIPADSYYNPQSFDASSDYFSDVNTSAEPFSDLMFKSMSLADSGSAYDFALGDTEYGDFESYLTPSYNPNVGGYGTSYTPIDYDYSMLGAYDFSPADYTFGGGSYSDNSDEEYFYDD